MLTIDGDTRIHFFDSQGTSRTFRVGDLGANVHVAAQSLRNAGMADQPVGLLFRSGPMLVIWWLATLLAKARPIVLHYPTEKQSREYWATVIAGSIEQCGLKAIVCDQRTFEMLDESLVPPLIVDSTVEAELQQSGDGFVSRYDLPEDGVFIQQSSGTTGMRKAIAYPLSDARRHCIDFNKTIQLSKSDCIVSWLPLYHDMGFIACFVMPLMLGVRFALIDPLDWVKDKGLLFRAIGEVGGTFVYMPNFGYEVMSMAAALPRLNDVRCWVSCSEPVRRRTAERFCEQLGIPLERMAACYAMAENVFAVTFRFGIYTEDVDGNEVVSCGAPIDGVVLKIVGDEIYVRSPYSIKSYLGNVPICDIEGYYPTGDLGRIINGELYIFGRKQDIVIQNGRKIFLSDIDDWVNQHFSWVRGRAACIASYSETQGTERCVLLIEHAKFFSRHIQQSVLEEVSKNLPIEGVSIFLVPPGLIVKSSSGKVNRRATAARWMQAMRKRGQDLQRDKEIDLDFDSVVKRLRGVMPSLELDRPLIEQVDSLGIFVFELDLGLGALAPDEVKKPVREIILGAIDRTRAKGEYSISKPISAGVKVIGLSDPGIPILYPTDQDLVALSTHLGRPVEFEFICLPPAMVILNYLIYIDWFADENPAQEPLRTAVETLKQATAIIADDWTEMAQGACAYPLMDMQSSRNEIADLLVYRYQKVARNNEMLPIGEVLLGKEIDYEARSTHFADLAEYLGIPLFRVALDERYREWTHGWEHQTNYSPDRHDDSPEMVADKRTQLFNEFGQFVQDRLWEERLNPAVKQNGKSKLDEGHYCSFLMNQDIADEVVERFNTIAFYGPKPNRIYLEKQLQRRGKRLIIISALDPAGHPRDDLEGAECIVQAGGWGNIESNLPVIRLMHGAPPDFKNIFAHQFSPKLMEIVGRCNAEGRADFTDMYVIEDDGLKRLRERYTARSSRH